MEQKVYNPAELNKLLLNETSQIARKFNNIYLIGDITEFKKWSRGGCSFKLTHQRESVMCKVWERCGITPEEVKNYLNTKCLIIGDITAEYFNGHNFSLNVSSIKLQNNKTKTNELKEICQNKKYFENKKKIDWEKISKIGIISKKSTQGYDDFCNQLKVPLEINLEEICLEGCKTSSECIRSIKKLQECDLIMIIRGGGDTVEISNSFDKEELFETIKKSKIPIVSAIGHEQDKGDKLLITNVSDFDFPTPTALAKDLNKIFYQPVLKKLNQMIDKNNDLFNDLIENEMSKFYKTLYGLIKEFLKDKFGGQIVEVGTDENNIIVKRNGHFYQVQLVLEKELNFTETDIKLKTKLLEALEEEDISKIDKIYTKLDTGYKLTSNIKDYIKKIKEVNKLERKFDNVLPERIEKYYLKRCKTSGKYESLSKMKQMLLWYQNVLENGEGEEVRRIYKFIGN